MKETANCIVCGKELERDERYPNGIVYGGVFLKTTGAYGSTAYDAMMEPFIETVICDDCFRARKNMFACAEKCNDCMQRKLRFRHCEGKSEVRIRYPDGM